MVEGDATRSAIDQSTSISPCSRDGELLAPTILVDRYQIERRLGSGGMGVVYAARDLHLGREVAVKVVGDVGAGQERLVREAQAMARLRHPNIATVHDIGLHGERLFVVMELVDGGTVAEWLAAAPRSWREVVSVYLQAARGLAAAHAAGFVHRDFKPQNVLLGKDGVARVSDFGVARLLSEVQSDGGVVGTPGYIAPEILRHEAEDARADQYSFCVALARGLARGAAPRSLLRIVDRGRADRPADRWPTMAALSAAIERHLRRRRALAGSAVAVAAAAAATIFSARRPAPPPPEWSPVVMERTSPEVPLTMTVSPDGSTLASVSGAEAWVGPRVGAGPRHRVPLPAGEVGLFRLSRTGDRLFYATYLGPRDMHIWEIEVGTGRAERRVPTVAMPAIAPIDAFDVGPDDELLFVGDSRQTAWRADRAGAVRHVMSVEPGAWIRDSVWSRDGTRMAFNVDSPGRSRIEVLDLASGRSSVVSHCRCLSIEWLADHSLACAPMNFRRPRIIELVLPAGGGQAEERIRFDGPEFQTLDDLDTSSAGVLFATVPFEHHLSLLSLDAPHELRAIVSGGISDLPAAGWTSSGALIFGTSIQGQLRLMRRLPDGTVETLRIGPASEVPLAVLGETIIFGRFPGGESSIPFIEPPFGRRYPEGELFRLAPGSAPVSLGVTRGFVGLVCAAGRIAPCLLHERDGDEVIAVDWNAESGARGRERARWNVKTYSGKGSLSPDGRTLAQVQRYLQEGNMSLLDLEGGRRRSVTFPRTEFFFPSWQPDGSLLALAQKDGEVDIMRVGAGDTAERVAVLVPRAVRTFAAEFHIAPDGRSAAVLMTESPTTYWWAASSPP